MHIECPADSVENYHRLAGVVGGASLRGWASQWPGGVYGY